MSLWYWRNVKRLGNKKAITAVARKLLCYIYAMLENKTLYDKSLDDAYADSIGAMKLEAAQKIVGSRKSVVPHSDKCVDNLGVQPAPDQDGIHEEAHELGIKQAPCGDHQNSGIESPGKTTVPKKRGRPKKVAASG